MRKAFYIIFFVTVFLSCAEDLCLAVSPAKEVRKGNLLYKNKEFDEALKEYNKALAEFPDSDIINFNMGAALYEKGNYPKAVESFTMALITENPDLETKANYNIGNCKYRAGKLKENTDLAGAIDLFRESLDYYKIAIELNEKDSDAKYNHEFVERKLKALLDKSKQQQEEAGGQEKKQEQESAQAKSAGSEEKEEEEKEEEEAGEEEGELAQNGEPEEKEAGENGEEPKEMSEEEARMLLEGYEQEEDPQGEIKKKKTGRYPRVLKDW